jgi:hypothetical protein
MIYLNSESKIWHWYFHSFLGSLSSEVSMCHTLIVLRAVLAWFIGLHLVSTRVARTLPVYQYQFYTNLNTMFLLTLYQSKCSLQPSTTTRQIWKFYKKNPITYQLGMKRKPQTQDQARMLKSWYQSVYLPPPYWPQAPKKHDFPSDEMVHHLRILQKILFLRTILASYIGNHTRCLEFTIESGWKV